MVDIPGNSSTTRTIAIGGSISDVLETRGDHDWIRIQLTAGQSISVSLDGLTLEDPYLRILDSNGNVLYENDDISSGVNRDSLVAFTATYTGTYFIDVAAWEPEPGDDVPGYTGTGTYTLSVSTYTPPPIGTVEQLADYLVSGYWAGEERHFNITPGGSITVNLTALTAPAQTLAIAALATWTDIVGITFVQVSSGGQITFDDNQEGAFSTNIWSDGIITSSHVNVSVDWIAQYGTGLNSYSFQTFIHEIGHALGLGHQGGYNGDARYPYDAEFQNDGWPLSVMSYFDQDDNTYFAGQGFDFNFITTPMMADILAMSMMYGLSTTTRADNTTYGSSWNSNMGALCLFDSGGTDTIDLSASSGSQRIDLTPGSFSNIMGEVGNVSIALGVIIENAVGGSGNDTIVGNAANNDLNGGAGNDNIAGGAGVDVIWGGQGNDTLSGGDGNDTLFGDAGLDVLVGGAGNDIFHGNPSELSGDTIVDFSVGDRLQFTGVNASSFTFSLVGSTLQYTGGSLTLTGFAGTLVAVQTGVNNLVELISASTVDDRSFLRGQGHDFNGDGRSDVLWRNDNGAVTNWLGQDSGRFADNGANAYVNVPGSWHIAGTGDFNGDGRDDVLWRNDNGTVTEWLGQASGGFADNSANAFVNVPGSWHIAGTGDFNGDGRDDVLWRNDNGAVTEWLGQANGGFLDNGINVHINFDNSWHIAGAGDFNGDGRDDVLWRNDNGTVAEWLGQADGGFADNGANAYISVPNDWDIVGIGDFNGDGLDDVLWRNSGGTVTDWLGQANGGFADNGANVYINVDNGWHVQPPDIQWI